jgi:MoxR-like ATPase
VERRDTPPAFETTPELVEAVNAALQLRRPLLLTGLPGSGKSTLIDLIAVELDMGRALRWHITSKSLLNDGLFHYDALGRLQAIEAMSSSQKVFSRSHKVFSTAAEDFVTLGPLGTALACKDRPRAVLVDEIDKSDLDLPGDLLNVLEEGFFDVPQLVRESGEKKVFVRGVDREKYAVEGGRVEAHHFPVIVMTSNGERAFPPPFLRRCIRYNIPTPDSELLARIVARHLGGPAAKSHRTIIDAFAERLRKGDSLAIDQLLNTVHLVTGQASPASSDRIRVEELLLRSLREL